MLGKPIDGKGDVGERKMPIHRNPPSEEQAESSELLETGIKVIDLMCPLLKEESRSIWWSWCRKNREHDGAHSKYCL